VAVDIQDGDGTMTDHPDDRDDVGADAPGMPEHIESLEVGLFAVDADTRTVRGLLVPYGERSRLTVSKTKPLWFNPGDLAIPRDPSVVGLNRLHDRFDPMGHGVEIVDRRDAPSGVVAEFRIADTPEGDDWLSDHGTLVRLSPEVRNIRRRPDGSATAELTGAALVDEGAFASAGLFALGTVEETTDELVAGVEETPDDEPEETPDAAPAVEDNEPDDEDDPVDQEGNPVGNAPVPDTLAGGGTPPTPNTDGSARAMFRAMSAVASGHATPAVIAQLQTNWGGVGEAGLFALNDVDYDGTDGLALGASGAGRMTRPQWLGEVLDGTEYRALFAPLFGHGDLTSLYMQGWKWNVKPKGGAWSGNKAAIPSNAPTVTPVSEPASRWAGGHDHAREHVDFGTPGYFESYYAAMVEDYLRWLDEDVVLTELLAAATEVEADNPSGLTIGSAMSKLVDGAASVVAAGLIPTFAILPTAEWKSILKTPDNATLGYLNAALGLDEGTLDNAGFVIRPSSDVTNPIVGARSAATVYELAGSPIRAEALNIANGGIDTGLFGYGGLLVTNAAGIVEVTPYPP
jgi:hypothetical protein